MKKGNGMSVQKVIDLVKELVKYTGKSYIVIDASNEGARSNWLDSFPSLDDDGIDSLGEPFAIAYNSPYESMNACNTLCQDLAEGSALVNGWIHHVTYERGNVVTISFDSSSDETRPFYENGELTWVDIVD